MYLKNLTHETLRILHVEDNPADLLLTRVALHEAGMPVILESVSDGEDAMAFVQRRDGYEEAERPDLILLDLNLPRKDGREVLKELKENTELRSIPVIVLSSSESPDDVYSSYQLHANCFVTKPVGLTEFNRVVHAIQRFWSATAHRVPRTV